MYRFFNHFHPKMPLFLVSKLKLLNYDSEKFIVWYMKFPDLTKKYKGVAKLKNRKDWMYIVSAYYIWIFYLVSVLIIATSNIVVGMSFALISPFIVGGYIYSLAYMHARYKAFSKRTK